MLELYQTEWCPASRRIRERLTELGVDYLAHQVPVKREERVMLIEATGHDTIPTLVLDDGAVVVGEDAIGAHLDAHFHDRPGRRRTESRRQRPADATWRNSATVYERLPRNRRRSQQIAGDSQPSMRTGADQAILVSN